ncbi:hypothetical protein VCHA50O413_60166 [Vibrio chagasii]|nr:hypothetical protein VCHA34P114_60083 [Vibrio chagasii]CAH7278802.1 hypothetical protein VCHA50O409_50167 [Vibrio chagasii]CAH7320752.1 hypothetical protein VCHA50O405_50083 [Vibrio chagasii]CAH7340294.1 hypothetical protein VCHA50O402_50170 [Vibrio chagasii]CAH7368117.1 hypothetical protein VCHA50O404_60083 [Vibrio chagasii]
MSLPLESQNNIAEIRNPNFSFDVLYQALPRIRNPNFSFDVLYQALPRIRNPNYSLNGAESNSSQSSESELLL